uniref:Uncharacterized protein n=1 Tax=Yersinia enterocolitica TaxID=630 RepID=B0RL59_YEREN|nr:hypothetical protein [Yersinia enterocolitica]
MLQQRIRGWDFFIRSKADIFQVAKKDGKTKTAGRFTVSTDKCQIMLTEIGHSGQR